MQCIFGERERPNCVVHYFSAYCIVCAAPYMWSEQLLLIMLLLFFQDNTLSPATSILSLASLRARVSSDSKAR